MFARLLFESFRRQLRRKALALLAIALGMSVSTAMIAVATGIEDKIRQELSAYGANLVMTPVDDSLDVNIGGVSLKPATESAFLRESDLPRMKGIFWGHNIAGYAPFLSAPYPVTVQGRRITVPLTGTYFAQPVQHGTESFITGTRSVDKFWKVDGQWPGDESSDALAGAGLAASAHLHIGDTVEAGPLSLRISGILRTGGAEDEALVAPLHLVQRILGRPDAVHRVAVSALTKPEDAFARQNPKSMSPAVRERWYCSPYANSIAFQLRETFPDARVEQVRQVEQNQGRILSRISGLMLLLTLAALLASALAVSALMAATVMERRQEIGLMKSLGAGNGAVASLFLAEAGLLALAGGAAGFAAGAGLAHRMGQTIFGSPIRVAPVLLAIMIFMALLVAFGGSLGAIRKAMRFDPAVVLRGDA